MSEPLQERAHKVAESWLGTPYRHQGSAKGIGCDCLGLIRGVWRELYGAEPEEPAAYAMTWSLRAGPDRLMAAAERHLCPIALSQAVPGDVLMFRWRPGAPATHCAIADAGGRIIHAYQGASVVSTALPKGWHPRVAGAFRFPE